MFVESHLPDPGRATHKDNEQRLHLSWTVFIALLQAAVMGKDKPTVVSSEPRNSSNYGL